MKVKELIELLKTLPNQDANIYINYEGYCLCDFDYEIITSFNCDDYFNKSLFDEGKLKLGDVEFLSDSSYER